MNWLPDGLLRVPMMTSGLRLPGVSRTASFATVITSKNFFQDNRSSAHLAIEKAKNITPHPARPSPAPLPDILEKIYHDERFGYMVQGLERIKGRGMYEHRRKPMYEHSLQVNTLATDIYRMTEEGSTTTDNMFRNSEGMVSEEAKAAAEHLQRLLSAKERHKVQTHRSGRPRRMVGRQLAQMEGMLSRLYDEGYFFTVLQHGDLFDDEGYLVCVDSLHLTSFPVDTGRSFGDPWIAGLYKGQHIAVSMVHLVAILLADRLDGRSCSHFDGCIYPLDAKALDEFGLSIIDLIKAVDQNP